MVDSATRSKGAKVVAVTSSDENHPPENIIDGTTDTFWMSTGMFPQEFIIRFAEATGVSAVSVDSYNVKHLKIEKNTSQHASQFEPVTATEFENTEGRLQSNTIPLPGVSATHLRFIIAAGYDHFVSVHRLRTRFSDQTQADDVDEAMKVNERQEKENRDVVQVGKNLRRPHLIRSLGPTEHEQKQNDASVMKKMRRSHRL